jgi:hypothetical protein
MEKVYLWEILVPASSDEDRFSYDHHKIWDDFVKELSGGLTILKSGKGEWLDRDNKLYKDRVIPVRIACTRQKINRIVKFTIDHYSQEAVMFYKISEEVYIIDKRYYNNPNDNISKYNLN